MVLRVENLVARNAFCLQPKDPKEMKQFVALISEEQTSLGKNRAIRDETVAKQLLIENCFGFAIAKSSFHWNPDLSHQFLRSLKYERLQPS